MVLKPHHLGPPTLAPPRATLISDHSLFRDFGRSKHVPDDLLELIWRYLTDVPNIHQVRDDRAGSAPHPH